jgi:hypothetical protein
VAIGGQRGSTGLALGNCGGFESADEGNGDSRSASGELSQTQAELA